MLMLLKIKMYNYAVVEFSDATVAAVPVKWLINSRTQCFWPPLNSSKLCMQYADAQITWKVSSVNRIFGLYSSYAIARSQAKEAEMNSNLESETELTNSQQKKATRKERRKKIIDKEDEEDLDIRKQSLIKPPPFINVEVIQQTDGELPISFEEVAADEQQFHIISTADGDISDCENNSQFVETEQTPSPHSEGFYSSSEPAVPPIVINQSASATMFRSLKTLELKVEENKLHLEEILRRLDRHQGTAANQNQKITKPVGWPSKFPLEDDDNFQEWEQFLSIEKNFEYAVSYFSFVSKCGPAENVRNFLSKTLTNHVAEHFNWMGHGDKEAFKNTFTKKLLYAYPRTPSNSHEEKTMDEATKNWLKSAKARSNYTNKRTPK